MVDCEWEERSVIGTGDLERRSVLSISYLKSDILFISSSFRVSRCSLEAKIVLLKQASVSVLIHVFGVTFYHVLGKTLN